MSEGDVSLIHDEDLLRRMWQQTEDFSRKKEIRAHMYRLREERLRNLYSPEPPISDGKGCEFTSAQGHVKSFADQTFQSMKSKEVRDAGSPPKEFTYRGQDLKELSNAGWNVESENRTTDDGHTHLKTVHANIEGRYDVDGGRGQFTAVDTHAQAVTEYQDQNTSVKRNESSSDTAAREQVVRQTDDGTQFSSITSSSTSSSKFQQVSSTKHETVPYLTNEDYDLSRRTSYDSQRNEDVIKKGVTKDCEQSVNRQIDKGELMSRKVEYPDENTKIIVETRCLPDGTRVTSTRREFRAPMVESTRTEHHTQQTRNESKSYQTSSQQKTRTNESVSQTRQQTTNNSTNIVDSQRFADVNDFKQNQDIHYSTFEDTGNVTKKNETNINEINKHEQLSHENYQRNINQQQTQEVEKYYDTKENKTEEVVRTKTVSDEYQTTYNSDYSQKKISQDWSPTHQAWASTLRADSPMSARPSTRASSPGSSTFQSSTSSLRRSVSPDKTCRKPPSRGGSPSKLESKSPTRVYSDTYRVSHSTQSISETKTNRYEGRPPQGRSPTRPSSEKTVRKSVSPEKNIYETTPKNFSPDSQTSIKTSQTNDSPNFDNKPRHTPSPDRRSVENYSHPNSIYRSSSPSKPHNKSITKASSPRQSPTRELIKSSSPTRPSQQTFSTNTQTNETRSISPSKVHPDDNKPYRLSKSPESVNEPSSHRSITSPDKKPNYMKPTAASQTQNSQNLKSVPSKHTISQSPDRESPVQNVNTDSSSISKVTKVKEDHYKFIDEETKMYTHTIKNVEEQINISNSDFTKENNKIQRYEKSPSPSKQLPSENEKVASNRSSMRKVSRSPSPSKGPVTFEHRQIAKKDSEETDEVDFTKYSNNEIKEHQEIIKKKSPSPTKYTRNDINAQSDSIKPPSKETSPINYGTYDIKKRYSVETDEETITARKPSNNSSDSPTKKSPRTSPVKYGNAQRKTTSDFITIERSAEALNNKTSSKTHPRQLVTPSSSPTRKPKSNDTEPSTGQSSPTTSVSGFIYFSSPAADKTIVTDLDEQDIYTDVNEETEILCKRPENLRTSSPSKIPCRSPSPEKCTSPPNDKLPRKSSLKKIIPADDKSPPEKPPSNFRVSPAIDTQNHPEHKIVKKDRPDKPETVVKSKPPLERRETYEERCRKILGMMDDNNMISKKTKDTNVISNSPILTSVTTTNKKESLVQNTDIINTENTVTSGINQKTTSRLSRDNSPTKLQDIISISQTVTHEKDNSSSKIKKLDEFSGKNIPKRLSASPEKGIPENNTSNIQKPPVVLQKEKPTRSVSPTKNNQKPISSSNNTSQSFLRQETYNVDDSSTLNNVFISKSTDVSPSKDIVETKRLRTPSPEKNKSSPIHTTEQLLLSEKEREILDRVQKSLRNLSPNRPQDNSSREQSPTKFTTSSDNVIKTQDDIDSSLTIEKTTKHLNKTHTNKSDKSVESIEKNITHKVPIRTPSPIKKPTSLPSPTKSPTDSSFTPRSISPKKSATHTDRPQSPQVPKVSGTKREPKQTITKSTSPIKMDKVTHTTNENKRSLVTNQSSFTKATPSKIINKSTQSVPAKSIDTEMKIKNVTRNINNQKHYSETKVTRAASDISIKPKKNPPQRMKSKPEIKVSEATTTKLKQVNTNKKIQIPSISQPNVPSKPKSATALNTPHDDDDIIIDVQQAKSSRESSPDRICPTPINYTDDISTPRYPDEINEPDDEFRKRTHHTLHEAESIVDDIVEICEDEELFVRNTTENNYADDSYDIRDNKVNKSNGILKQPKHITQNFKDTERNEHSDFIGQKLKSDECLLSVSQKVDKFARGVNNVNDIKISTRNVVDEYDNNTTYQDDYTKLSVNDKAHLFVETAENLKAPKIKPNSKVERPDLKNVDESLKTDDCLLSVSDKVNKFVKTAEQFLTHSQDIEEKERKINEQHDIIMKKILKNIDDKNNVFEENTDKKTYEIDDLDSLPISEPRQEKRDSFTKETVSSFAKVKDHPRSNLKPQEKTPTVKITTMRSSEAVKKAKALFENIASTQKKDTTHVTSTKLTDIGVMKKSPKTDSTVALHPSEEGSPNLTDVDSELDVGPHASETQIPARHKPSHSYENKPRNSPSRYTPQPTHASRTKSPVRQSYEKITVSKSRITHSPTPKPDAQNVIKPDNLKSDPLQVPSYQRPTKTSQMREEVKITDETEVSSRRGSGKFGVELRRTSLERSTVSSERRRSTEHHQPCIEDIFDLDLLEQMLEKVVGYEQRRRIRAQIRIVKQRLETSTESDKKNKSTKYTTLNITQTRSPDRHSVTKSPDRQPKVTTQKPASPERQRKPSPQKTVMNHHSQDTILNEHRKESIKIMHESRHRPRSPEKQTPKSQTKSTSPLRQPSPEKKTRSTSPSKAPTAKPKTNRFSEYASAYLKKVGVNDKDMKEKIKTVDVKTKKTQDLNDCKIIHQTEEHRITETKSMTSKSYSEETSSRDVIEVTHVNGKRTPSPEKKRSPERKTQVPTERLKEKSPSPVRKRQVSDIGKMETKTTSIHNIEKNFQSKQIQEEKPSWVTNRNLKKITSENRTFSSKKIENDKPKYRAPSPSKVISRPTDVITSSYGPGPLDADGKPLFGIKALRNGATNYQVKGTVIRQEFRSQNGGEPEGTVSVTAYGAGPALDALLAAGGERPSRLHGLAAITTTRRFGPHTGHSIHDVTTKEERAALDQFTHNDRRVSDCSVQITEMIGDETLHDTRQKTSDSHNRRDESSPKSRQKLDQSQQKTEELQQSRQQTQKMEERHERTERREDRKTVRQSSVKSLTEKFIKNASETSKSERSAYPKAGLILRTTSGKDIVSSDSSVHAGLARTDSEQSLGSVEDVVVSSTTDRVGHSVSTTGRDGCTVTTSREGRTVTAGRQERVPTTGRDGRTVTSSRDGRTVTATDRDGRTVTTTTTRVRMRTSAGASSAEPARQDRSFLDSTTKVTGVQDILTRMRNADIVIQEGDSADDAEARALLNKFLGATVLMAGMQGYVADPPRAAQPETIRSSRVVTSVEELDLDQCWDERLLKKLLDECTDYEQRRKLRARIRSLMAEQEACAAAVTEALAASGEIADTEADAEATSGAEADAEAEASAADTEREEEVTTVTSSVRRNSSEKSVSSSTTTKTTKVIESMTRPAPKPVSPFAKFRQLEKQNSTNSPNSPKTPQSPGSPSQPYFKFTDPALQASALTIKERLLQWCRDKTRDYENVKLENFSTSWADGLAFCALVHHFLPDAFDYSQLTPDKRRHNFTLAFKVADEKAGIYPLLDVDDMVAMRKPDWKCVFTYVQAIHRRFREHN
ncbi:hypothetical protein ACJJTC_001676 [Scirpophaga incertulas]